MNDNKPIQDQQQLLQTSKNESKSEIKFNNLREIRANNVVNKHKSDDIDRISHSVNLRKEKRDKRIGKLRCIEEQDTEDSLPCDTLTQAQCQALLDLNQYFLQLTQDDTRTNIDQLITHLKTFKKQLNQTTAIQYILEYKYQRGFIQYGASFKKTSLVIEFYEILLRIMRIDFDDINSKQLLEFQSLCNVCNVPSNATNFLSLEPRQHGLFLKQFSLVLIDNALPMPFPLFAKQYNFFDHIQKLHSTLMIDQTGRVDKLAWAKCLSNVSTRLTMKDIDNNQQYPPVLDIEEYVTTLYTQIGFLTKKLPKDTDFECNYHIWRAVQDVIQLNKRLLRGNLGYEIDDQLFNSIKDYQDKIMINEDYLQLVSQIVQILYNITSDEIYGIKISRRKGADLLKVGAEILIKINLHRTSLNSSETYVKLESYCLQLLSNVVQGIPDLSEKLLTYKVNDGILLQMMIEQYIKSPNKSIREGILLLIANIMESATDHITQQLQLMQANKIELQNMIYNQNDSETIVALSNLIMVFANYLKEQQEQSFKDQIRFLEEIQFINQIHNNNSDSNTIINALAELKKALYAKN